MDVNSIADKMYKGISIVGVSLFLLLIVVLLQGGAQNYFASLLNIGAQHEPYDGLVSPIKKVPDWVSLNSDEWNNDYDDIDKLIKAPEYNPSELDTPTSDLKWGDDEDDMIRNAKITYSVVYMGTYEFDHEEYGGGHPAVDIKLPEDTPIYSIGNGVVTKVSTQSTGFGHHIVVRHDDFPSFDNPAKNTTYYSSYSHLNDIDVEEGDIVSKGEKIGESGNTGTSTAPHLHFQIDEADAEFHPYWHFTYSEAQEEDLSFFEAVNEGLNSEKAEKYTINPMMYVQKYDDNDTSVTTEEDDSDDEDQEEVHGLTVTLSESNYEVSESGYFEIQAYAKNGDYIEDVELDENIKVSTLEEDTIKLDKKSITDSDFNNGKAKIYFEILEEGNDQIILTYDDKEFKSDIINTLSKYETSNLKIIVDDFYTLDQNVELAIKMVDKNDELIEDIDFEGEMELSLTENIGELSKKVLDKDDFIRGIAEVSINNKLPGEAQLKIDFDEKEYFSPTISIEIEQQPANKLILLHDGSYVVGQEEKIEINILDSNGARTNLLPNGEKIQLKVINGQAKLKKKSLTSNDFVDGIAYVEFVVSSDDVRIQASSDSLRKDTANLKAAIFSDVEDEHKNHDAISYLKENNIVKGYEDGSFKPEKVVTRVEALKMILEGINEDITNDFVKFSDTKINAWYSKYISTAFDRELVKGYDDGSFRPSSSINRVEFLKILLLALEIDLEDFDSGKSFDDVSEEDWYYQYALYASKKNIISTTNLLPSESMTRGDVAEVMYRVILLQETGADEYFEGLTSSLVVPRN